MTTLRNSDFCASTPPGNTERGFDQVLRRARYALSMTASSDALSLATPCDMPGPHKIRRSYFQTCSKRRFFGVLSQQPPPPPPPKRVVHHHVLKHARRTQKCRGSAWPCPDHCRGCHSLRTCRVQRVQDRHKMHQTQPKNATHSWVPDPCLKQKK